MSGRRSGPGAVPSKQPRRESSPVSNSYSTPRGEFVTIGKIVAAQGLQGELRIYPESDFPERFEEPGDRWLWKPGTAEPQPVRLLSGRYHGRGLFVVRLEGITNRTQAEELQGALLLVPASDRPTLEEDEFHIIDLIGLEVFDQATQTSLGTVVSLISAGNDLLEVQQPTGKTVLIPFVKPIVPVVDLEQKRIEITPPAGLIE